VNDDALFDGKKRRKGRKTWDAEREHLNIARKMPNQCALCE